MHYFTYTPTLVRIKSDYDLDVKKLEQIEIKLIEALRGRVAKAFLFGSSATQTVKKDSDIDLLLITDDVHPNFVERSFAFADLLGIFPRIDILVYTSDEFQRNVVEKNNEFWIHASKSMRQIV